MPTREDPSCYIVALSYYVVCFMGSLLSFYNTFYVVPLSYNNSLREDEACFLYIVLLITHFPFTTKEVCIYIYPHHFPYFIIYA